MNDPELSDSDRLKVERIVAASERLIKPYCFGNDAELIAYGDHCTTELNNDEELIVEFWLRSFAHIVCEIPDWQKDVGEERLRVKRLRQHRRGDLFAYDDCENTDADDRIRIVYLWTSNFDRIRKRLNELVRFMEE